MTKNNGKYALITGASQGLGYEFAKLAAQDGYNLVIVSRTKKKLDKVKKEIEKNYNVKVKVLVKDLAKPSSAGEIFSSLKKDKINVEMLINNAGYARFGLDHKISLKDDLNLIHVDLMTPVKLTKLYLKLMVKKRSGMILNVASIAGFQPMPYFNSYGASKSFILNFSEALYNELKGTGVHVTCVCPGVTKTGFIKRAKMEKSRLTKQIIMKASTVAKEGYRAMLKRKRLCVPGIHNKFLSIVHKILPRPVALRISRFVSGPY
ncbi:MAG: SDR family oxidoreductase [Spirochaetes bacterium]|nr:SDR family oxidoreductase [Spirochaetota bacterium]